MIKISVISYNNEALVKPLSAVFDEHGGTLGRSDDNHFVLPDPKRYVSRLQASIRSDGVSHKIVNLSQANPILVNGLEIEPGQEYGLNAGDEIQIGLYLLCVESHSGAETNDVHATHTGLSSVNSVDMNFLEGVVTEADPFADLLGTLAAPVADLPPSPAGSIETSRSFPSSAATPAPLTPTGDDDLPKVASGMSASLLPETPAIPDDFDPFSLPSQSRRNTPDPLADLSDNGITLESLKHDNADFFDLTASASYEKSHMDTSSLKMSRSSEADPLALFSSDSASTKRPGKDGFNGDVLADHAPELNAHFIMPQIKPLSLADKESELSHTVQKQAPSASARQESISDPVPLHETPDIDGTHGDSTSATNADQPDSHELMLSFLRGAGIPPDTISAGVTPEFMEMVGQLLTASIQGTVELIASRTVVKREVRADMTMIVPKKNNPLKFLPDGKTVLMQMLRERLPGFMKPMEAIEDAYIDLCAHQIGVVAGMRSAMAEMLERFNPELLEKRMKDRSFLDAMLPANRKARMWDRYTELFKEIRLKAQDDFQELFGKAFVAAYEMEIERFRKERKNG